MEKVERGEEKNALAVKFNKVLKNTGLQAWTQPFRNDETDKKVVQVERFRNHVWWVGGNGLTFRPVLQVGFMLKSIEMVDVIAEVSSKAISTVSHHTLNNAFWTEGFTADGAGWGHGKQCLVWGYPILGTTSALSSLTVLQGSPWAKKLNQENLDALFNAFRGTSWFYFKGYEIPALSRGSMEYQNKPKTIGTKKLLNTIKKHWISSLNKEQKIELNELILDSKKNQIIMSNMPKGNYSGTRWFFNNDNFVKKTTDYHAYISMASFRSDGIEIADWNANGLSFYTCDGMTLFQKNGDEYHKAKGGWNLTAIPGVTTRQGQEKLIPVTNWRGYCSRYNFAAAATSGGANGASGFIFEKLNASSKKDVNDKTGLNDPNEIIYGVKAYKSYFMIDDYIVTLGAGITNKRSDKEGNVWTTIDQTLWQNDVEFKTVNSTGNIGLGDKNQTITLLKRDDKNKQLVWAQQKNGFAYAILPKETTGSVHLSLEKRATKWGKINNKNKSKNNLPKEVDIFQLWINHGQKVKNGKYGYITYMGNDFDKNTFKNNPVKVIQNDTLIHAVSSIDNKVLGAIFYDEKATLKTIKGSLKVSSKCAVLIEKKGNSYLLTVTDALMDKNLKSIELKTTIPVSGKNVVKQGKWRIITIPMPQGALCGKPSTIELDFQ